MEAGMARLTTRLFPPTFRLSFVHSARTAIAAAVSLLAARLLRLPEAYWASITTLIVMQSTLGAALTVSGQRFAGTALGAVVAVLVSTCFRPSVIIFGVSIFGMGLICSLMRLGRAAYRFAGITLAIILLVTRTQPTWIVATHRFVEVSIGIAVGLILTAIWPER
jgi:uncharacterized membrane protein YgaE (UPF0421/DUF939 family)